MLTIDPETKINIEPGVSLIDKSSYVQSDGRV